jgi:hypothetical protein
VVVTNLTTKRQVDWSWIGAAAVPAKASHDMTAICDAIARGRKRERT